MSKQTSWKSAMPDPPNHFFKFIPPGFKFDLSIPSSFLRNLNPGRCSKVKLRRGCHEWSVDIDDGVFGDGWRSFVRENGVQEFDFIAFKHQGNMVFNFLVFDQSTCERQYPSLLDEMEVEEQEPPTESDTIRTLKELKKLKKRKRKDYASQDPEKFQAKNQSDSAIKKATGSALNNHPYFISTLKPSSFKAWVLYLPVQFSKPNGLKVGKMILRDEKGRSWEVRMKRKEKNCLYIGHGIKPFLAANGFKEGDAFKFELLEKEKDKPPIARFSCIHEGLISSEVDGRKSCKGELKSTHLLRSYLNLPRGFARYNGLIYKKNIYLKNAEDDRLWKVELSNYKSRCHIERGWKEFCVANGLKEGDFFKLELIHKGEKPILNFYLQKDLVS